MSWDDVKRLFLENFHDLFIQGFCISLVRPAILLFLLLVLLGKGRGLGVPLLFWRPKPYATPGTTKAKPGDPDPVKPGKTKPAPYFQFMVGIGVGSLVWQVLLAGYVFEEFASNYTVDRPPYCESRAAGGDEKPADETNDPEQAKKAKVPAEPEHSISIGKPVAPKYNARFRFDPLGWDTMWGYAGRILLSFAALGAVFVFVYYLITWIGWLIRRIFWRDWKPFKTNERKPVPLPYSIWLPAGVVVGALALSLFTWGTFAFSATDSTGKWITKFAGWGKQSGRQAMVRNRMAEQSESATAAVMGSAMLPVKKKPNSQAEEEDIAREWFSPYYPVYAAFLFNFILITSFSVGAFLWKRKNFTPAVGIVLVLHIWIFLATFLTYFSPIPAEFTGIVFFGLVLIAGGGYKLKYPNFRDAERERDYYSHPESLEEFYRRRAADEADETRAQLDDATTPTGPKPTNANGLVESDKLDYKKADPGNAFGRTLYPPLPAPAKTPEPKAATATGAEALKPRLAIVCVSGGGSRAAAWTMKVLTEIEEAFENPTPTVQATLLKLCEDIAAENRKPTPDAKRLAEFEALKQSITTPVGFPYHVRLVTGASGGMISGAYYVASLAPPKPGISEVQRNVIPMADGVGRPLTRDQLCDDVCEDFLTPIVHTLVTRDLPSLFSPWHLGSTDRGTRLEDVWTTTFHGQLDQTFEQMQHGEEAGWRPSLIFSPMMVEDGRQLFISNLDLKKVVQNSSVILGEHSGTILDLNPEAKDGRRLLSREGMEFFKIFPDANDFRLSTAARMSASFPYVLPAAYLPTNPPRRVVDAGYYDNYGVGIASSWLFGHMKWIRENTSGVVVIQIRDGASGASRRRETVSDSFPEAPATGLHWFTGPPEGIWAFRQAAQSFRNDNLLHLLSENFVAQGFARNFLTTISFELQEGDDVALNYTLTEGERATIHKEAESVGFRGQIRALLEWWHGLPPA